MKSVLKGKLKEATDTLERITAVESDIETAEQIFRENNLTDIMENAKFVSSKMNAYKTQLHEMKQSSLPLGESKGKENFNDAAEKLALIFRQVWQHIITLN